MRVLLADDSDLILERLEEMVNSYGRTEIVGLLNNGIETLDALRKFKPDVAIVDMKLSGLSGLEVISEIRKENKEIKVIMITYCTSDQCKNMAILAGADFFFNKVDDFDEVSMVFAAMVMKELNENRVNQIS